MNTTRSFRLSNSHLAAVNAIDTNRSRAMTDALKMVVDNPQLILEQLRLRLDDQVPVADTENTRVTVYLPAFVAGGFDELVTKMRLPVEDMGRIAVEAFIRRRGKSTKESHEPARSVQHASEGRNHP